MSVKLSLVGIRSKTTTNKPTYFFSIESCDLANLRIARDIVMQSLWVHNMECDFDRRYHDG